MTIWPLPPHADDDGWTYTAGVVVGLGRWRHWTEVCRELGPFVEGIADMLPFRYMDNRLGGWECYLPVDAADLRRIAVLQALLDDAAQEAILHGEVPEGWSP